MRCTALIVAAHLCLILDTHAHGGFCFRGPVGPPPPAFREPTDPEPPPPPIPCKCHLLPCKHYRLTDFYYAVRPNMRRMRVEETNRWHDLARLKVTATIDLGGIPYTVWRSLTLKPAPTFAPTGFVVRQSGKPAAGRPTREVRPFLNHACRKERPAMLLLSRGPGMHRAFLTADAAAGRVVFTMEGLSLARPPRDSKGVRLYRSKTRVLAIVAVLPRAQVKGALFHDRRHGRALFLYPIDEARRRFGNRVDKAVAVPDLNAFCDLFKLKGTGRRMFVANVKP